MASASLEETKRAFAFYRAGPRSFEEQDGAAAIQYFKAAVDLLPGFFDARLQLSEAFSRIGQSDSAISCAKQAVAARPLSSRGYTALAAACTVKGAVMESIQARKLAEKHQIRHLCPKPQALILSPASFVIRNNASRNQ